MPCTRGCARSAGQSQITGQASSVAWAAACTADPPPLALPVCSCTAPLWASVVPNHPPITPRPQKCVKPASPHRGPLCWARPACLQCLSPVSWLTHSATPCSPAEPVPRQLAHRIRPRHQCRRQRRPRRAAAAGRRAAALVAPAGGGARRCGGACRPLVPALCQVPHGEQRGAAPQGQVRG